MTPRLVFLHGVGGGRAAWDRQVAHFTRLGFPCTAWDQPGYGASPMVEPYSLENIVSALKDLVGASPAVLVGHSMGGFIAQESYARHPELVRALALCFTSPAFLGRGDFARKFIAARIEPLDEGKTMAEVAALVMPGMRGRKSDPQGFELAERIMSAVPPDTYRRAVRLLTSFDRRANLARIAVPTLLVAGADDQTAPPAIMQKMAEEIPRAEYVVLEGCGHLGPMDQPEAFNAALEAFLRRL